MDLRFNDHDKLRFLFVDNRIELIIEVLIDLNVFNASLLLGLLLFGDFRRFALTSEVPIEGNGDLLALDCSFLHECK